MIMGEKHLLIGCESYMDEDYIGSCWSWEQWIQDFLGTCPAMVTLGHEKSELRTAGQSWVTCVGQDWGSWAQNCGVWLC